MFDSNNTEQTEEWMDYNDEKIEKWLLSLENLEAENTQQFKRAINLQSDAFFKKNNNYNILGRISKSNDFVSINAIYSIGKNGNEFYCVSKQIYGKRKGKQCSKIHLIENFSKLPGKLFLADEEFNEDEQLQLPLYWSEDGFTCGYRIKSTKEYTKKVVLKFRRKHGIDLEDTLFDVSNLSSGITWHIGNKGIFYLKMDQGNDCADGSNLYYHKIGNKQKEDIKICWYNRAIHWNISFVYPNLIFLGHLGYCIFLNNSRQHPESKEDFLQPSGFRTLFSKYNRRFIFELINFNPINNSLLLLTNYGICNCVQMGNYVDGQKCKNKMLIRCTLKNASKGPKFWKTIIARRKGVELCWIKEISKRSLLLVECIENHNEHNLHLCNSLNGQRLFQLNPPGQHLCHWMSNGQNCLFLTKSLLGPEILYQFPIGNYHASTENSLDKNDAKQKALLKVLWRYSGQTGNKEGLLDDFEQLKLIFNCKIDGRQKRKSINKSTPKGRLEVFCRKNLQLDGSHPLLICCYGAVLNPSYNPTFYHFLTKLYGIIAVVHARGDGFLHKYAKGAKNKFNTFADIISAAEFLIKCQYTSPKRIAIIGHSNGGLSATVCANERPDLFAAIIASSGVYDLERFPLLNHSCASWIKEYGNPKNANDLKHMLKFSPLHNAKKMFKNGISPPSLLLLSGDSDGVVSVCHTLKYIALMQWHFRRNSRIKGKRMEAVMLAKILPGVDHYYDPLTEYFEEILQFLHFALDI